MPIRDWQTNGVQSDIAIVRDWQTNGAQSDIAIVRDWQTNGVQSEIWKREIDIFNGGSFGLGAPVRGNIESGTYHTHYLSGATYYIATDGRMDVWFPTPINTTGYSQLNTTATVIGAGSGTIMFGIATDRGLWLNNPVNTIRQFNQSGTYSVAIPAGTYYIGLQALFNGANFSRIWLS